MGTVLRRGRLVARAAVVLGLLGGILAPPATAQTADAARIISLVNSTRAAAGSPPVILDAGLSGVAQSWAGTMAAGGALRHNPNLGSQIDGWTSLAENIGMAGSIDAVHQILVASPRHHANMTDPGFTHAGAGSAASGGNVFVVQVFMQGHPSTPAPPPPPPVVEPAPEPEPVYVPEPEPVYQAVAPPAPEPSPVPVPTVDPVPAPPVTAAPAPPVEASNWLALVLEQLRDLELALG